MKTTEKIALNKITIHWTESHLHTKEEVSFTSYDAVNEIINRIARDEFENKRIGYCKMKVTVEWEDGVRWSTRIDITGDMFGKLNQIQSEIINEATFYSGTKPNHMDKDHYEEMVSSLGITLETQKRMKNFLADYEL